MLNRNLAQSLREVWSQSVVPAIVQVTRPVTRPHVLILAHLLPPPSLALYSYSTYRTYCTYYSVPRS